MAPGSSRIKTGSGAAKNEFDALADTDALVGEAMPTQNRLSLVLAVR